MWDRQKGNYAHGSKNINTIYASILPDTRSLSEHIKNFNHEFDWENVKVLDVEHNYQKRLISEMIHIKSQKLSINVQKDTELLNES